MMPFTAKLAKSCLVVMLGTAMLIGISPIPVVAASLNEQLTDVQKQLAALKKQKQDINGRINTYKQQANSYAAKINGLNEEINLLDTEIQEQQLQIDELNLSIGILQDEIEVSKSVISQVEYDIEQMQYHVDSRIRGMYLDYKTGIGVTEIDATLDEEGVFKKVQYKSLLVEQTKELVEKLNLRVDQMNSQKVALDEKNNKLTQDLQAIDQTKATLDAKKAELVVQRQNFYALQEQARRASGAAQSEFRVLSEQEAKTRADEQLILQKIFQSVGSVPNGSFVKAGTIIGYEGMTGVATGPHLHLMVAVNGKSVNPCTKLGSGPISGCSGDGSLGYWPFQTTHYFTSSYGNRCYNHNGFMRCSFHDGIDLQSSSKNSPIFAARDGWLQRGAWACSGSLCNGGATKYVIICDDRNNCNNGLKHAYLHLR